MLKAVSSTILIGFCLLAYGSFISAQSTTAVGISDKALSYGERMVNDILDFAKESQCRAAQISKKIWQRLKSTWNSITNVSWQKMKLLFERKGKEPEIKEEFKKETEEIKEKIPWTGKSLWGRVRDFIGQYIK